MGLYLFPCHDVATRVLAMNTSCAMSPTILKLLQSFESFNFKPHHRRIATPRSSEARRKP